MHLKMIGNSSNSSSRGMFVKIVLAYFMATNACRAENPLSVEKAQFETLARLVEKPDPWNNPPPVGEVQTQRAALQATADKIVALPAGGPQILEMLEKEKENDSFARQAICYSIYKASIPKADELSFFKKAFELSLVLHAGNYPPRLRGWISPQKFRIFMAERILAASGNKPIGFQHRSELDLLISDPNKWLNKYAP